MAIFKCLKLMREFFICLLLGSVSVGRAEIELGNKTTVAFASVEQGRSILLQRDDFVTRLSPFDRGARLKTDREISEEEFLNFVSTNVLAFTESEKSLLTSSYRALRPKLGIFHLPWPDRILQIKTTGKEEGDAAYTRGSAVIVPESKLRGAEVKALTNLLCHELFHVLSRRNPALREKLYEAIGFQKCQEIAFPASLMRITNPDAPANDHCIRVTHAGQEIWTVPILYSESKTYDPKRGGEFFNYLRFRLLKVQKKEKNSITYDSLNLELMRPEQVSGFFEQVGRNTQYIIHPEEILADNFVLLINGDNQVPNLEILASMKKAFETN